MAKITRFFENYSVSSSGREIKNIIGSTKFIHTGEVEQVVVELVSGSATSLDIEIRYESGNNSRVKLVYLFEDAELPLHVDSNIKGPFNIKNSNTQGDLHLFLHPDASCVLNIRVDFQVARLS